MPKFSRITVVFEVCLAIAISLPVGALLLHASDMWEATGPLGGAVNSLAVHPLDPNVVFAIVNEKLYVTSDGGSTRTLIPTCPAGVWQVRLDPSDGGTMYAVAAGRLYRSTDAGDTWTEVAQYVGAFAIDPNHPNRLFIGAMFGSVRKSTNHGDTWTDISFNSEATVRALAVSPGDSNTLYAGMQGDGDIPGGGIYKSTNGGSTWIHAATDIPGTDISTVVVDPIHPDTILVSTQGGPMYGGYGVYRSMDGAQSWSAANSGLPCASCPYDIAIADLKAIPGTSAAFCVIANSKAFRSDDGGDSWAPYSTAVNDYMTGVEFSPADPEIRYFGAMHGVWRLTPTSIDRRGIVPVGLSKIAVEPHSWGGLFAVSDIAYISWDSGLTWDISTDGTDWGSATAIAVSPEYSNFIFVGGYNSCPGLFRSDDGGMSWETSLADVCVNAVAIDPADCSVIYAGGLDAPHVGGLFKSTDNGALWTKKDNSIVMSIAVDPSNHNTVYMGTQYGGIKKSTDGGATWTPINNGLPAPQVANGFILSIAVDPRTSDILYCVLYCGDTFYCAETGYFAYKSTNAGADWTLASTGLSPWVHKIVIDPVHPWVLYAASGQGVYRSANRARTWEAMSNGLPSAGLNDLVIDPSNHNVLYCCSAAGLYRYESSYEPTGADRPASVPVDLQAFPNPFSSGATIEYSVSSATQVRVKVYDVAGRLVATLVDTRLKPGRYRASLGGTHLSAGVYFIEGRFGDQTITKKCVLMK
jgi:photosystem II stability/assembly factor-like uncharacterized protein